MSKNNFLQETLKAISDNNKTPADVLCIGDEETRITDWNDFVKIADFEYDCSLDDEEVTPNINSRFIVCGKDWWLQRYEDDDRNEWWEFKEKPKDLPIELNIDNILKYSGDFEYFRGRFRDR